MAWYRVGGTQRVVIGVVATLLATQAVSAQARDRGRDPTSFVNQQRDIEEDIRRKLDEAMPPTDRTGLDFGLSYSFYLFLYDDGIDSSRTIRRHDLRAWSRLTLDDGAHEFYVRGRVGLLDFNTGDSFDGNDDDWEGPNLERGFYKFDLRKAVRAQSGRSLSYNLQVDVGRDLVTLGTGYALSLPLDHVQVRAEAFNWQLTGLVGRTVGSSEDFDRSRPTSRTRRMFFGAEMRYLGFDQHQPFAYVLWQEDQNHDNIPTPLQGYDYDSFYFGIGSQGELVRNLRYSTEWVWEWGRGYGDRRFAKKDIIRAWAFDFELEYLFDTPSQARASIEYMFASGDSDRLFSPTDTVGGNRDDFTDTGFNGFGWRSTGLSLSPELSNVHIWRMGASFFPFHTEPALRRMELGSDAYLFWKHHRAGAISDPTAGVQSGYLGWELDVHMNWELTHDLAWTVRGGLFLPGKAFEDRTSRTFLLTGLTWSF